MKSLQQDYDLAAQQSRRCERVSSLLEARQASAVPLRQTAAQGGIVKLTCISSQASVNNIIVSEGKPDYLGSSSRYTSVTVVKNSDQYSAVTANNRVRNSP